MTKTEKQTFFSPELTPSALAKIVYQGLEPSESFYNQAFWGRLKEMMEREDYKDLYYPIFFKAAEEILSHYNSSLSLNGEKKPSLNVGKKHKNSFLNFTISLYEHQTPEFNELFEHSVEIKNLFLYNPTLINQIYKEEKSEAHILNFLNIKSIAKIKKEIFKDYEILYTAHRLEHTLAQKQILAQLTDYYKKGEGFIDLPKVGLVIAGQTSSDEIKGRYFYKEKRQAKAQMIEDMLNANIFPKMEDPLPWPEQIKEQIKRGGGASIANMAGSDDTLYIGALFYLFVSSSAKVNHVEKILSQMQGHNALLYKFFMDVFSQNSFLSALKKEDEYISDDYEKISRIFLAGKFQSAQICSIITKLADCYDRFHNKPYNGSHFLYMMASLIKVASKSHQKEAKEFFDMHPRFLSFLTTQEVKKSTLQNEFMVNFELFYAYLFSVDKSMVISPKALSHWEDAVKSIVLKIANLPITLAYMKSQSLPQSVYPIEPKIQIQTQLLIDRALELVQVDFFRPEMRCALLIAILKNINEFPHQVEIYDELENGKKSYTNILYFLASSLGRVDLIDKCMEAVGNVHNIRFADLKYREKIDILRENLKIRLERSKIEVGLSINTQVIGGTPSSATDKFKI